MIDSYGGFLHPILDWDFPIKKAIQLLGIPHGNPHMMILPVPPGMVHLTVEAAMVSTRIALHDDLLLVWNPAFRWRGDLEIW